MLIKKNLVSDYETNCYIVSDEDSKDAVVIDPGDDGVVLMEYIREKGLTVRYILNTHGHFDHCGNNDYLKAQTGALVAIHTDDAEIVQKPELYTDERQAGQAAPDILLHNGDVLEFGRYKLTTIYTPGHTRGGVCFWEKSQGVCFTGDTLFRGTVGRVDLYGGDLTAIIESVQKRLAKLGDEVILYPGHGPTTTMGYERKLNRYLRK